MFLLFRNNHVFSVVFASNMKRDYTLYPSTIGGQPGVVWFFNDSETVIPFDDSTPLTVQGEACTNASLCVWYTSPLIPLNDGSSTQFALLGEQNKWTAVSRQRFSSIEVSAQTKEATVTVEGVANEIVPVIVYHSVLLSLTINCPISSVNGQAKLVVSTSNVVCS